MRHVFAVAVQLLRDTVVPEVLFDLFEDVRVLRQVFTAKTEGVRVNGNGLAYWKAALAVLVALGPIVAVVTATVINHESRISVGETRFDHIIDALKRIESKVDK